MAGIQDSFSNLRVSHKIWLGLGLVLIIMAVISGSALFSLSSVDRSVSRVVNNNQPLVLSSMQLAYDLSEANAYLGFFLLSKEPQHKQAYLDAVKRLDQSLAALEQKIPQRLRPRLEAIKANIQRFQGYQDRMLKLSTDRFANFPAMTFAARHLNPVARDNLRLLAEMILSEDEEVASVERRKLLNQVQELRYVWLTLMNQVRVYLNLPTPGTLENIRANQERLLSIMDDLESMADMYTFEQEEGATAIRKNIAAYTAGLEKVVEIQGSDKRRMDAHMVRSELGPLVEQISAQLNSLVSDQQAAIQENSSTLLERTSSSQRLVAALLLAGLLLGAIVAWLLARVVSGQLRTAVAAMHDVADGDGDLTRRLSVHGRDEIGRLAQAFNRFSEKVQGVVAEVAGATARLTGASRDLDQLTHTTANSVQRQQGQLHQLSVAVSAVTDRIRAIVDNTGAAAQMAEQADSSGRQGRDVVERSMRSILQLNGDMETAAEVVRALDSSTESIAKVLDVIQGIAEQTNLLALNAAIEAARAGDQGRGFAVVADEVRTLASRTQQSTMEIQAIIESLQQGSAQAVHAVQDGLQQAQTNVELSHELGGALDNIATAVARMVDMNNQIAEACGQQQDATTEVSNTIREIAVVADGTTRSAERMATASQEVAGLSDGLQALVRQFRI